MFAEKQNKNCYILKIEWECDLNKFAWIYHLKVGL